MLRLLPLALLLFLVGCDSSEETDPIQPPPAEEEPEVERVMLMPLEVGNRWVYNESFGSGTDTLWIAKDTTIGGTPYWLMKEPVYIGDDSEPRFIYNHAWRYVDEGLEYNRVYDGEITSTWLFKYPDAVGFSTLYDQVGQISRPDWDCVTVFVSADSVVTVPTGEYSTAVYRNLCYEGDELAGRFEWYFAEGIGRVLGRDHSGGRARLQEVEIGDNPDQP